MAPQLACQPFVSLAEVLEATCACALNEDEHGPLILDYANDASDILYVLSGGRISGRCTRTVWPWRSGQWCGRLVGMGAWAYGGSTSYGVPGGWLNREGWVDMDSIDSIPLMGPGTVVTEVKIDGVVVPPTEYALLDGYKLFRRSGSWPGDNDIRKAPTEAGTFTITYTFGSVITHSIKRAAIELICQMVSGSAALTQLRGVVSANVQGVSVQMDPEEVRSLGLPELSRVMDTYSPMGMGALGVFSPELNHGWRMLSVTGA